MMMMMMMMISSGLASFDADCGAEHCGAYRSPSAPNGLPGLNQAACCAACVAAADCSVWVHEAAGTEKTTCYLLTTAVGTRGATGRTTGGNFSSAGFTNTTLDVKMKRTTATWRPGTVPVGNLLGTAYSLDGVTGGIELRCWEEGAREGCSLAPISRDGWAVFDDSASMVIDPATGWIATPSSSSSNAGGADLYLFTHGLDFKGALRDYSKVAGSVPKIPRYVMKNDLFSSSLAYMTEYFTKLMIIIKVPARRVVVPILAVHCGRLDGYRSRLR